VKTEKNKRMLQRIAAE